MNNLLRPRRGTLALGAALLGLASWITWTCFTAVGGVDRSTSRERCRNSPSRTRRDRR